MVEEIFNQINKEENPGMVASYIPELAKVDDRNFAVAIKLICNNEEFGCGDSQKAFSIQSISKVLLLSLVYKNIGEEIWKRVGVEPSGTAFNSLVQLEADKESPAIRSLMPVQS